MQPDRPRVLVLAGRLTRDSGVLASLSHHFRVDVFEHIDEAITALRREMYHGVFADVGDFLPLERELVGDKAAMVLNTIGEGVCIVDSEGRCVWSNKRMRAFASEVFERVKHLCVQARRVFSSAHSGPIGDSTGTRNKKYTLQVGDRYFELMASPVLDEAGGVRQVVAVVWDSTSGKRLQQKIDAIDAAGRELARLEGDAISKLSPGERLQLMQDKIIRYSRDLMHFDHFAIRLLDKRTGKLEVVISQGLPTEALEIDLYAQPEGNGISGYVASTGRSYICHDTEKDPRYVVGLAHCKSSLTVPLMLFDKVVGVYNIESSQLGAFSEDDRQFAEIFGRYVALSLHILDLLVVERCTTTGLLADNVVQEMAQPLNDIVTDAQTLMEEYIGDDSMRQRLNTIVANVQMIRETCKHVAAGPNTIIGAEKAPPPNAEKKLLGRHILIADDEINIRNTIGDILRQQGAVCTICKDGYEACNMLDQEDFDLIVSDIKMPYRTGYEIFAAAKRVRESLPVILMTGFGYDPNHSIVRASQEGLSSVLFKPFKVNQLLDEVYKALALSRAPASPNTSPQPTPPPTPASSPSPSITAPPIS